MSSSNNYGTVSEYMLTIALVEDIKTTFLALAASNVFLRNTTWMPDGYFNTHRVHQGHNLNDEDVRSRFVLIRDKHVCLSIRLQAEFGLRREEVIKFSPGYAIQDDPIALKASWTKGGRARSIPITNDKQRTLLNAIKQLAKGGSLIPPHLNYLQQLHRYERQIRNAGLTRLHGQRHGYAQRRYLELTGWSAPASGGPKRNELTPEQRAKDHEVRLQISRELGHSRENITAVYLGMDRNKFNADVRPYLTEIPLGKQSIAFDRLEIDAWVEDYKNRNGRPSRSIGDQLWDEKQHRASKGV